MHIALSGFGLFGKNVVAEGAFAKKLTRAGNFDPLGGRLVGF